MDFQAYGIILLSVTLLLFGLSFKFERSKKMLILVYVVSNFIYLGWRVLFTVPDISLLSLIIGLILLVAEMIGYLQSLVFYTILWKPKKRRKISMEFSRERPTVDIFIATYNEPINVLRKVVASCTYLDYPKELITICLCDDGRREEVRRLAKEFNIRYIERENNEHAKAGNLNHAMKETNGEIIVTLDADMVVKSDFLDKTIGYFENKKVAFVQTPQAFYNADPFQYNLFAEKDIPNEQDFFMRILQAGRDRFNSIVFVGTNTLFRRSALKEIGGFATGVITEDMATGMLLQAKYKTVFVDDVLARGLSVESWEDLIKQRDRWCRGNIQCAKKWNPLTHPGLTMMQRIIYLDGILYWFFGLFKMIYITTPLLFLLFSIYSLNATLSDVLTFWLPAYVASRLAFTATANKKRNFVWNHIYETAMSPYLAISATFEMFFNKQFKFNVTPKGVTNHKRIFKWKVVMPHLVLFILTTIAYIKAGFYFMSPDAQYGVVLINLFWITFNSIGIVMSILIAFERPRFRQFERFPVGLLSKINHDVDCRIADMSETGMKIISYHNAETLQHFENDTINIELEGMNLTTDVVWVRKKDQSIEAGLNFNNLTTDEFTHIVKILFDKENYSYGIKKSRSGFTSILYRFVKINLLMSKQTSKKTKRHLMDRWLSRKKRQMKQSHSAS